MEHMKQTSALWKNLTASEQRAYAKKALSWNTRNGRVKMANTDSSDSEDVDEM
jgi:hypothetical protein